MIYLIGGFTFVIGVSIGLVVGGTMRMIKECDERMDDMFRAHEGHDVRLDDVE